MTSRTNRPGFLAPIALAAGLAWPAAALLAQTPAAPSPAPKAAPAAAGAPVALCADCHTDQATAFSRNPHARSFAVHPGPSANAPCESCHGDGSKHMEAGGDAALIRRFHDRKGADFCTTCHRETTVHASFKTGMHANRETVNCLSCHSIHSADPKGAHLNWKPTQQLCAGCHPNQDATIRMKPFTHRPVAGGVLDCSTCHDPHGRPGRESLRLTRTGEPPCLSCHSEKRGPFVYEHPTGQSVASAADCFRCHEPHGSSNPKMLIRAQVYQLCLECHSPIAGNTIGSQPPSFHNISLPRYRNCTTCHVAIHGSNLSPRLFK